MLVPRQCTLCPRQCLADRTQEPGYCLGGDTMLIASAFAHQGEERCLSGTHGSGTVFFSGCNLRCVFCQNYDLRDATDGEPMSVDDLVFLCLRLAAQGVHNLNMVTPTHYRPWIQAAMAKVRQQGITLPLVWNTSGYETLESIEALENDVHIWLYDLKFHNADLAQALAQAPDYFDLAFAGLKLACAMSGPPILDEQGIMRQGVIVRMLVLPGHSDDCIRLLEAMAQELPRDGFFINLMDQYFPPPGADLPKKLQTRLKSSEFNKVLQAARDLGFSHSCLL